MLDELMIKMGDFVQLEDGDVVILACVDLEMFSLISLKNGNRVKAPIQCQRGVEYPLSKFTSYKGVKVKVEFDFEKPQLPKKQVRFFKAKNRTYIDITEEGGKVWSYESSGERWPLTAKIGWYVSQGWTEVATEEELQHFNGKKRY